MSPSRPAPPNHFDRGKPFYPFIANYIAMLFGLKELAGRGLSLRSRAEYANLAERLRTVEHSTSADEAERLRAELNEYLSPEMRPYMAAEPVELLPPLTLRCASQADAIGIDTDEIALDLLDNRNYIFRFSARVAGHLLMMAYEATTAYHPKKQDNGPLWEFLRHCRNAVGHNGRFFFKGQEPLYTAEWGPFRLHAKMHDDPLFETPGTPGLLALGDPIRLLWDIEQAYPAMIATVP